MIISHEIAAYEPQQVSQGIWQDLHQISVRAYSDALQRPAECVEHFTQAHNFEGFYAQQLDPNARLEPQAEQQYYDPKVVIAYHNRQPVGYAYAANNTSGETPKIRQAKYNSITKRHFWIGTIVVDPDHRAYLHKVNQESGEHQQRVGMALLRNLLSQSNRFQPVAAYTYPDEFAPGKNAIQPVLEAIGMRSTGERLVDAFGTGQRDARLVRFGSNLAWATRF